MKKISQFVLLFVVVASLFLSLPVEAKASLAAQTDRWCGAGSAPNYGFDTHGYSLTQPYWVIGNGFVSEQTQKEAEVILDKQKEEQVSETMVLILPEGQVADAVNCAVHLIRYMKLGLPDGPRKDNGFAWLFIMHSDSVEVRYGVGLGLPALTAPNLGDLKRVGVDTYNSTKSIDSAVLAVINRYDTYARSQYGPGATPSTPDTTPQAAQYSIWQILFCIFALFILLVVLGAMGGLSGGGGGGTYSSSSDSSYSSSSSNSSSSSSSNSGSGSGASNRGG